MDLIEFLTQAQLDAIGVFGYSDEDKTEGKTLENKVAPELIKERVNELSTLVDELITQRAEARIGQKVTVLIEDEAEQEGRAEHQGPDVDGSTFIKSRNKYRVGEYVDAVVSDVLGVDLIAQVL
jgi:tRNA A37 methylthiotransferase MiaB